MQDSYYFYGQDALPVSQPLVSKHWRRYITKVMLVIICGSYTIWVYCDGLIWVCETELHGHWWCVQIQVVAEAWVIGTWGIGRYQWRSIHLTFSTTHVDTSSSSDGILYSICCHPMCYHSPGTALLNIWSITRHEISVPSLLRNWCNVCSGKERHWVISCQMTPAWPPQNLMLFSENYQISLRSMQNFRVISFSSFCHGCI